MRLRRCIPQVLSIIGGASLALSRGDLRDINAASDRIARGPPPAHDRTAGGGARAR